MQLMLVVTSDDVYIYINHCLSRQHNSMKWPCILASEPSHLITPIPFWELHHPGVDLFACLCETAMWHRTLFFQRPVSVVYRGVFRMCLEDCNDTVDVCSVYDGLHCRHAWSSFGSALGIDDLGSVFEPCRLWFGDSLSRWDSFSSCLWRCIWFLGETPICVCVCVVLLKDGTDMIHLKLSWPSSFRMTCKVWIGILRLPMRCTIVVQTRISHLCLL